MSGINETKEMVAWLIEIITAILKSYSDKKLDITDLKNLVDIIPKGIVALDGATKIPAELSDLSKDELIEIYNYIKDNFKIDHKSIDNIIQVSLEILNEISNLVNKIKSSCSNLRLH